MSEEKSEKKDYYEEDDEKYFNKHCATCKHRLDKLIDEPCEQCIHFGETQPQSGTHRASIATEQARERP